MKLHVTQHHNSSETCPFYSPFPDFLKMNSYVFPEDLDNIILFKIIIILVDKVSSAHQIKGPIPLSTGKFVTVPLIAACTHIPIPPCPTGSHSCSTGPIKPRWNSVFPGTKIPSFLPCQID